MEALNSSRVLNETDFDFLYHLEQVTGSLSFESIPEVTRIILPNLRIIRGEELLGNTYALVLVNVAVTREVIFPTLTEISRGNALIDGSNRICNLGLVNWPDILDDGTMMASFQDCNFPTGTCT